MTTLISVLEKLKQVRKEIEGLIDSATVIFIDMTESTTYKDERGIAVGVEKVIKFNLDVTKIIKRKGEKYKQKGEIKEYEICKYIGDEVMAYFKGKNSSKVAIEIAIDIQKYFKDVNKEIRNELDEYKPKMGIDFGDVLFAQYYNFPIDPYGLVVDRAARIVSLAKPYQILISEDAKTHAEDKISVKFGRKESKKFKGIKEEVGVHEVIWNKKLGELGIKFEEEPSVFMIPANEPAVYKFIKDNNLLEPTEQIDLSLYTYETLAAALRYDLEDLHPPTPLIFRVRIRNPLKDPKKRPFIQSSIGIMAEVIKQNSNIIFNVRFYDNEPLLRTYIFRKRNKKSEGLLGLYKFDPKHSMRFVGAEYNYLIHARGRSFFERHLLDLFQSRFDYSWDTLTEQKAVIFDLDGVIIDSMPFYYKAWKEAFETVGVNVSEEEIYMREGEKREITAKEIFKEHKGYEPDDDLIRAIVKRKEEAYHRIFKSKIFPGIVELLNLLKAKNIKLGLVTGSVTKTIEEFKSKTTIFSLFDVIVTGGETKTGKPSPEPYLKAVEKLLIPARNCYVIENAPLGIKSAKSASLTCFAVKGSSPLSTRKLKSAGADFVYKDIKELKKHIIWADTNMPMKKFLGIFEDVL
ncbi:MAG: hypothetical protein A7316_03500 [Candidatus Altiarchaeales archaeon WOR_SM1_86-2]|nr:MAG: hypothetical protein A7316_03500 [Candidatus Altiarchaeales archaeon WOR_SM1_86-2]